MLQNAWFTIQTVFTDTRAEGLEPRIEEGVVIHEDV